MALSSIHISYRKDIFTVKAAALKIKTLTLRLEGRGISEPCFKDRRIWESHIAGGSGMQLLVEGVLHGSGLD